MWPPTGIPRYLLSREALHGSHQGNQTQNCPKDPDNPPFKERFHRIPPPQVDEVREHLKLMLDAGVVQLSNSPCCLGEKEG